MIEKEMISIKMVGHTGLAGEYLLHLLLEGRQIAREAVEGVDKKK